MAHQVTLIPGDGIGPEVAGAAARAVEAAGVSIEWNRVEAGARALAEYVGGSATTDQFTDAVIGRMGRE